MKSTPAIMNWISRAPANSFASPGRNSLAVLNVKTTPALRSAAARDASSSSVRHTTSLAPARASATIASRFSLSSKAMTRGGRLNSMHPRLPRLRSQAAPNRRQQALEKPKGFTARAGVKAVLCVPLRNIDDVNGPVTLAGNEQFVTAKCHVHRLTANLDRGLLPE